MLPLHDDNPTLRKPVVTVGLILACVAMFLWQQTLTGGFAERVIYGMGMVPALVLGGYDLPPGMGLVPAWASPVTYQFLHGGWMHLIGNMWFLWVFGNNIEDSMGHVRFVVFYLLTGLVAAAAHIAFNLESGVPIVGASGAISGVMGAYMVLYPRVRVQTLIVLFVFIQVVALPAVVILGLWFALQLLSGVGSLGQIGGGVAFWAHVGGFVAGVVLIKLFERRKLVQAKRENRILTYDELGRWQRW